MTFKNPYQLKILSWFTLSPPLQDHPPSLEAKYICTIAKICSEACIVFYGCPKKQPKIPIRYIIFLVKNSDVKSNFYTFIYRCICTNSFNLSKFFGNKIHIFGGFRCTYPAQYCIVFNWWSFHRSLGKFSHFERKKYVCVWVCALESIKNR